MLGPLHMILVDRVGSVTRMKLVSIPMVTFSLVFEIKSGDVTIKA